MVLSLRPSSRPATNDASNSDALKLARTISSAGPCRRQAKLCRAVQSHDNSNVHSVVRASASGQTDALRYSEQQAKWKQ